MVDDGSHSVAMAVATGIIASETIVAKEAKS